MDLLSPDFGLFFWMIVNLLLFVLILYFVYKIYKKKIE